jgi:hypothetical protein
MSVSVSNALSIGKSNIFPKMRMRSQEKRQFRFQYFESDDTNGYIDIIRSIRRIVYEQELGIPSNANDALIDARSRHVIGFLGDFPAVIARWRCEVMHSGIRYIDIDRFATVPLYRIKGFAKACLISILNDVQAVMSGVPVASIQILVPSIVAWIGPRLEELGFLGVPTGSGDVLFSRGI